MNDRNSLTREGFCQIIRAFHAQHMSDSPTRPIRASDSPDDADREARIEQLLLTGLDHYFAGHYERAINIWTRVVFLERHHDRARAYIERARGAIAERLRRSEEFFHDGVSAYNAGEIEKARDLLTRAREQGSDGADVFLERLNRVGTAVSGETPRVEDVSRRRHPLRREEVETGHRRGKVTAVLFAVCVAATMLISGLPIGTWLFESQTIDPAPAAQAVSAEPLPVVRPSEVMLDRARTLRAEGRLREALRALDGIRVADPARGTADRLRAEIQSDIFTDAGMPVAFSPESIGRP
jgi:tetratricopeptide (TPR) repeat protein